MKMTDEQILAKAEEIIKYNQLPDQNGSHPNEDKFIIIEKAFMILKNRILHYEDSMRRF